MKISYCILSLLCLLTLSCAQNNPQEQLKHLNGYWEITKVITPNGGEREYSFSEQIDYIELKDTSGFRTKVLPRLDGTFVTTDSQEKIIAKINDDSLYLTYKTQFDTWKEVVLKATPEELSVRNSRGATYIYKKFEPVNITD